MKKIILVISLFMSTLLFSSVNAQPSFDFGKVVLTIHSVNTSNTAVPSGDYVFSMDNGSPLSMTEVSDGNYTDISFSGDFERNKKTVNLTCSIRISPSETGTFLLEKSGGTDNGFSINFDNKVILSGNHYTKGSAGKIVVIHYPKTVGDFLTGTFTATLNDETDAGSIKDSCKVTGSFKIKRFQ